MGNAVPKDPELEENEEYLRKTRLSWSHIEGEPRIFTPWDTMLSPGVEPKHGQDLSVKSTKRKNVRTVRFILGKPEEIPDYLPENSLHLHSSRRTKQLDFTPPGILKTPPPPEIEKKRQIYVTEREISNVTVKLIPFYFTRKGAPQKGQTEYVYLDSATAQNHTLAISAQRKQRTKSEETKDCSRSRENSREGDRDLASDSGSELQSELAKESLLTAVKADKVRKSFELPSVVDNPESNTKLTDLTRNKRDETAV